MTPSKEELIGRILGQRYRLERLLGAGGMGAVFEARQLDIGRTVAVKVLLDVDPRSVARLRQEALTAGSLSSPHVVSIFDFQAPDGEPPFIVMEILPGHSLAKLLQQEPVLSPARAARIACQMLIGLEAAHRAGVVHRDVKPSNTWLVYAPGIDEHVKMLDFGIAKMLDGTGSLNTTTGSVVGTPGYLSPEQLRGAALDARVDIHAMGVVLFEMLTGTRPWRLDSASVFVEILEREPPPVHTLVPNIPVGLSVVVARALAKDPDRRFQRASEMRVALEPFAVHSASVPTFMGALPAAEVAPRSMHAPPPSTIADSRPSISTHTHPLGADRRRRAHGHERPDDASDTGDEAHGRGRPPPSTAHSAYSSSASGGMVPSTHQPTRSGLPLLLVVGFGFVLLSASGIGAAFLLRGDRGAVGVGGAQEAATSGSARPVTASPPSSLDGGLRIASASATVPRAPKVAAVPAAVDGSAPVGGSPLCRCIEDFRHTRVCVTPLAPSCECTQSSNAKACPKPFLNGTCPAPRDANGETFGGPGRKTGMPCSGFANSSDDLPRPVTGTLKCSVCYGNGTVAGVAGGPCSGVNNLGTTEEGHFICDK